MDTDSKEVSLKEFILGVKYWWRFIFKKWMLIVAVGLAGGIIGLTYALLKTTTYNAVLTFVLQDEKASGGMSGALGLANQFGIDLGTGGASGEFSGDNLIELMKSRSMVERALLTNVTINGKTQTLAEYYIDFNNVRKEWRGKSDLENMHFVAGADRSKFTRKQDSILGRFHESLISSNVKIGKIDKKLSIISINVNSKNELFAKYFAEVLEKVVSDFYIQTRTEKAAKNVAILQHQTDSVSSALYGSISGVASSIDNTPNPNPLLVSLRVPSQRRQIDVQKNTAILTQLAANLEIAKMSLLQETPLIQVIDRPILPLEKKMMGKVSGIAKGGLMAGFLIVLSLTGIYFYKRIISDES
ncbi:Wzz/FepE/Etk N-terminal domain-containing protein [Mucilaginibacter puniceus]